MKNNKTKCFLELFISKQGFSLTDINLLAEYEHVQKVEIPYNDIAGMISQQHKKNEKNKINN